MVQNLGNVVGLIKSATPPLKTYVLWGKQVNPIGNPDDVVIHQYDGTNWVPLTSGDSFKMRVIVDGETYTIPAEREMQFAQDVYNKGTIVIETLPPDDYGTGLPVSRDGILRVDGLLVNEGLLVIDGLLILN